MKLAIVIPTYNRKELLCRLLLQIKNQKINKDYSILVIVVLDGSTDGTDVIIRHEFSFVNLIYGDGNWWFTKSLNKGISFALDQNVDFILTLNDDVVLSNDFFLELSNSIKYSKNLVIIGAVSYSIDNTNQITSPGVKKILWWRAKTITYFRHLEEVNQDELSGLMMSLILPTRGLLIPRDIMISLNMLDEKFPQYFSDYDFCLRAKKNGVSTYINYDLKLYTLGSTNNKTALNKISFYELIRSYGNPYSRNYFPHLVRYYWRHGNRFFLPITIASLIAANLKNYFSTKYFHPACIK